MKKNLIALCHLIFSIIVFSSVTHEALVQAIWKVKPIQKWEIESIQAVLDEEKEEQGEGKINQLTFIVDCKKSK